MKQSNAIAFLELSVGLGLLVAASAIGLVTVSSGSNQLENQRQDRC
jgi:hypothetical protein